MKERPLTARQREVLTKLVNGWELGQSAYPGGWWLQQGKLGHGGATVTVHGGTIDALIGRKYLTAAGYNFPTQRWVLTVRGRNAILEDKG